MVPLGHFEATLMRRYRVSYSFNLTTLPSAPEKYLAKRAVKSRRSGVLLMYAIELVKMVLKKVALGFKRRVVLSFFKPLLTSEVDIYNRIIVKKVNCNFFKATRKKSLLSKTINYLRRLSVL